MSKIFCLDDPSGLYPRGHWWHSEAFILTLRDGLWPPGMQVLMEGMPGHIRVVRGNESSWAQLESGELGKDEVLPPQRLEPIGGNAHEQKIP